MKPNGSWCIISSVTRNVLVRHVCSSPVTKKVSDSTLQGARACWLALRFTAHRNDCNNGTQELKE